MAEKLEYQKTLEKEGKSESELPQEIKEKIKALNGKIKGVGMSQGRYNSKPSEANLASLESAQFDVKTRDIEISDMILDWLETELEDEQPAETPQEKKAREDKVAADKAAADEKAAADKKAADDSAAAKKLEDDAAAEKQQKEQQSANAMQAIRDFVKADREKRITISKINEITGQKLPADRIIMIGSLKLERCWMSSTDYEIVN